MVLGWFGGTRQETLPELIARRKYAQAIELLRAEARGGRRDPRLRMQLADILDAAGRRVEAIPIYLELADGFAREGYVAKAIAVLKKVERIDAGRADVKNRLAQLAAERHRPPAPSDVAPTQAPEVEEIGRDSNLFAPARQAAAERAPTPVLEVARPAVAPRARGEAAAVDPEFRSRVDEAEFDLSEAESPSDAPAAQAASEASEAGFEEEFFDALVKTAQATGEGPAPAAPPRAVRSPLFEDFTDEEFLAVAAQLELHSFGPGDIVISEGEPGDSLFVLTTGAVKAFIRNSSGRQVLVREMGEGSFFGEISILSGKPRTATITCASACDLLELDRAALDAITRTHPRVQEVLMAFYYQRHRSGEEKRARGTNDTLSS